MVVFASVVSEHMSRIEFKSRSCQIALLWMTHNPANGKAALAPVMTSCYCKISSTSRKYFLINVSKTQYCQPEKAMCYSSHAGSAGSRKLFAMTAKLSCFNWGNLSLISVPLVNTADYKVHYNSCNTLMYEQNHRNFQMRLNSQVVTWVNVLCPHTASRERETILQLWVKCYKIYCGLNVGAKWYYIWW